MTTASTGRRMKRSVSFMKSLVLEKYAKTCLGEVVVGGQSLGNAVFLHDEKGDAVG